MLQGHRNKGGGGVKGAIPSPQIWAITSLSKTHYIEKPSFSAYPFKFSYLPTALCSWTKLMESRLTKMHVCWVCRNREKNTFFFLRFKSWIENAKSLLPRQIFYLQRRAPAETVWIENRDIPLQLACGFKKLSWLIWLIETRVTQFGFGCSLVSCQFILVPCIYLYVYNRFLRAAMLVLQSFLKISLN